MVVEPRLPDAFAFVRQAATLDLFGGKTREVLPLPSGLDGLNYEDLARITAAVRVSTPSFS
jgi:hypothetical protein